MKLIHRLALFTLAIGLIQCSQLPYEADIGFLNSAQANSMEWMVKIDGHVCRDLDGLVGACTKRVRSNHSPVLTHDARPYDYRLQVRCTAATGIDFSVDVLANQPWRWSVPASAFSDLRSFTCQGEIFPHDRDNSLSALWQIRFVVFDAQYQSRESIYRREGHFVMGKHAKYTTVCRQGRPCETHGEQTVVEAPENAFVYSESEMIRINYYGKR